MAQTKKELLEQLAAAGVEVNPKSTIAELRELIAANTVSDEPVAEVVVAAALNDEIVEEAPAPVKIAKAGKRSAKALEEAEEKELKEDRKAGLVEAEEKPKQLAKPARSRLERRGKKFQASAKLVETGKAYGLEDAIELAQKTSVVKFDATVELHVNLSVDPRHADQNIRDNLVLPAGTGKSVRVAVFADDDAAGADISGLETLTKSLEKGEITFDVLISTPANMPKLGKYARTLGPRGLMPNPKSGTVTTDLKKAVAEAKAGRVEYRVDSTGIVHLGIGKASFTKAQLVENLQAVLASIKANKPASVKSSYFKAIHLTTTMGPSITIDLATTN
jgi:large subunit ribosomal protein L1